MSNDRQFSSAALELDYAQESDKIAAKIRQVVPRTFKRRGLVVALSGGIDSSVVGALCVQALGKDRVFGLLMPERDSSEDTLRLSRLIVDHLGIETAHEDITDVLEAVGCYRRRDEAIQTVVPEYDSDYQCKIVLPSLIESDKYRFFSVIVKSPEGKQTRARLTAQAYLGIVAATNFKQRVRKMLEYYHADRLNYAVAGTPNRLEYDQGFFVKLGDGAADVKPIAHLYKTQVYRMAEFLDLPDEICGRPPTTDTYSMPQSQEEFYFSLPYEQMDLCLYGKNHAVAPEAVGKVLSLTGEQIERIYRDIENKRNTTRFLHMSAVLIDKVGEVSPDAG